MENLIIEHNKLASNRKMLGCLWIIIAVGSLFVGKGSPAEKDWGRSIAFCIIGLVHFTPLMGSSRSQIEICDGCLKIIWMNWYRTVTIQESEIEKIVLAKDGVKIYRKEKRAVKVLFYLMEKDQKVQVYNFFTEYAHQKNFVLGR
jgi:hypothetical protein